MRRFKKYFSYLFLFLMPLSVTIPPEDSTSTTIKIFGGGGQYSLVAFACSDEDILHKKAVPFTEFGASVEKKIVKHLRVGIKGEKVSDQRQHVFTNENYEDEYSYTKRTGAVISPFVRISFKYLELGFSGNYPTIPLHLGNFSDEQAPYKWFGGGFLRFGLPFLYFRYSIFYDYPLYLNGLSNVGMGSQITKNIGLWLGSDIGFYQSKGLLLKGSYRLNRMVEISFILRRGSWQDIKENGFGGSIKFYLK